MTMHAPHFVVFLHGIDHHVIDGEATNPGQGAIFVFTSEDQVLRIPHTLCYITSKAKTGDSNWMTFSRAYREWHRVYQHLPAEVAQAILTNAIVFVRGGRNAPVGEYPFVDIDEANVVYYRLGPWKAFGLPGVDWRPVYDRHFTGRTPYVVLWREVMEDDRLVQRPYLERLTIH